VQVAGDRVLLTPLDSFRQGVYLAPVGLWLTLDSGRFDRVQLNRKTGAVRLGFAAPDRFTRSARLHVEQPAAVGGVGKYVTSRDFDTERDAFVIPLSTAQTSVDLSYR
jgi:hypothetical protein